MDLKSLHLIRMIYQYLNLPRCLIIQKLQLLYKTSFMRHIFLKGNGAKRQQLIKQSPLLKAAQDQLVEQGDVYHFHGLSLFSIWISGKKMKALFFQYPNLHNSKIRPLHIINKSSWLHTPSSVTHDLDLSVHFEK